jgi:hypothetical protein
VEVGGDEPHLIMNPPDESPDFNHESRSKRPRITPRAAYTNHIVPRPAHSPLVRSPSLHLPPQEDEEWDDSQRLFTQPFSLPPLPPPPSPPPSPSTAAPSPPSLPTQPSPIPPPPMPQFDEISDRRKSVINRACSEIFSIDDTREFQVTATHYLSYYNSAFLSSSLSPSTKCTSLSSSYLEGYSVMPSKAQQDVSWLNTRK